MFRVFVYGSLMRGEPNHGVLERGTYLRDIWTAPGVAIVRAGPYPSLLFAESAGPREPLVRNERVHGELWEVDHGLLDDLDRFEGHPDWFARREITLDDGSRAHAYAMPEHELHALPLMPGGVWRKSKT